MTPDINIRNMPEGFNSLEYQNITNIHPLALVAVLILGLLMVVVPRRWSVLPMLIVACFISMVQKITVFGLDFNLLRIMVLFGTVRLLLRKEYAGFLWKPLDKAMILWAASSVVIYTLQQGNFSSLVNRLGFGFDAMGMYFMFRCLIREWSDLDDVLLGLILISVPVAVLFMVENRTGHNMFSVFGGVPAVTIVREDKLRCQGAFSHPIIAGCFWAAQVPLFAACWWKTANKKVFAVIGIITSLVVVFCCASSTPVMGVISAAIGGLFFFLRRHMPMVRWGTLLTLIALHMVMKKPVWHLVGRVSAVGGSTSYFRYLLIDGAITHFREWALLGTVSTAHWFWGAQDLTNHYVLQGVEGGFLTLCLFVAVIVVAFREVGKIWRVQKQHPYRLAISWALGVSLFVHCMNFIGVSYFGQINLVWYLLLATISSLSLKASTVRIPFSRPR